MKYKLPQFVALLMMAASSLWFRIYIIFTINLITFISTIHHQYYHHFYCCDLENYHDIGNKLSSWIDIYNTNRKIVKFAYILHKFIQYQSTKQERKSFYKVENLIFRHSIFFMSKYSLIRVNILFLLQNSQYIDYNEENLARYICSHDLKVIACMSIF
jgi:hypothetical protein